MNTILLLIGLLLLFAWYIRDRVLERKSKSPAPGDYWGVVLKRPTCELQDEQLINDNVQLTANPTKENLPGRLYYGIPGRSFKGYIWNGRIITGRK
ncbi:hypothetical protein [Spirosoma fluviale]|uniref:Uncharacterized protein n=1 Tax=Spirosoma fluviale TaxID=1597977 RepID=A0A286FHJ8_9BACT|nr:hypothetical protein [Spirosoma fluviale]SOD82284.1 hypothetical protein SAMN06269250_2085 [Spirosoma fluviale]